MIKQRPQIANLLIGVADLVAVASAWLAAFQVRFAFFPADKGVPRSQDVLLNMILVMLMTLIVLAGTGLYKPRRDKSFLLEMGGLLKAGGMIWGLLIVTLYYTSPATFTRGMLALFLPLLMAGLIVERGMCRASLRFLRRRGWNLRHAVIVGTGRLGQSACVRLQRNSWTGINVVGFIEAPRHHDGSLKAVLQAGGALQAESCATRKMVRGLPVLGSTEGLSRLVTSLGIDCIYIALPSAKGELLRRVVADLENTPADVRVIPDLFLSHFPANVGVSELDGMPILSLRENPLAGWPMVYKRVFDVAGALFGLVLLGVPMVLMAVAIKLQDGGPVFYTQRRLSYGRRSFRMLKFRTMVRDAEAGGPQFTAKDDPRCTRLGRYLRALSLDELPQFFNILRGDMSLVGPRPERPEMLESLQKEVPGFPLRLQVRAGLTGWAQVHGFRGRTSFRKRLQYDLYYLNNWSPLLDLRILVATVVRGFRHPNAY